MRTTLTVTTTVAAMLLSAGVFAAVGLDVGTALAASPSSPAGSPIPADNYTEPHQWCPGQNLPEADVHWDMTTCHTWFWVPVGGTGNVGEFVWEGDSPRTPLGPPPCYGAPICLPGL